MNSPWIFSLCWKVIKPWLNEKTLSKIQILDNSTYQQVLRDAIDEKYLPDFLGGKCNCDGAGCVPLVDPDEGFTEQQVSARGKFEHECKIDDETIERVRMEGERKKAADREAAAAELASTGVEPPSSPCPQSVFQGVCVSYEFRTRKNDICFEIRRQLVGSSEVEVVKASKRYESDHDTITGSLLVTAPCKLVFAFDNAFSYFTSKTLLYRVDLIDAQSDAEEQRLASEVESVLGASEGEVFSPTAAMEKDEE